MMSVRILGSGSWEGVPAFHCNCPVCSDARHNPNRARTRPATIVVDENGTTLLIECGPDIRLQSNHIKRIDAILISHFHYDHAGGLPELDAYVDLVRGEKLDVYAPPKSIEILKHEYAYLPLIFHPITEKKLSIGSFSVYPFEVRHIRAMNAPRSRGIYSSAGFLIEKSHKKLAYLGDYYAIPSDSIKVIEGSNLIIADGTYLFEDYFKSDYARKIRAENDPDHLHGNKIIAAVSGLRGRRLIYQSISHLSGLSHEAMQKMLPEGHELSYDGMTIEL